MTQTRRLFTLGTILGSVLSFGVVAGENPTSVVSPLGYWKTEDQKAIVNIYPCLNDQQKLCGKIVKLRDPIDPETGNPKVDKKNDDAKLRDRPLLGLEMLTGFIPEKGSATKWEEGAIYSPTEGKTYRSTMELDGDTLKVAGYVLFFSKTQKWTRVPADAMAESAPVSVR